MHVSTIDDWYHQIIEYFILSSNIILQEKVVTKVIEKCLVTQPFRRQDGTIAVR